MKLLLENWRKFRNLLEAGDPDSDVDNSPEPAEVAKALERSTIEDAIQNASFNSARSSQHRWSPRQPIIDYRFDARSGVWTYTADIPDGTNDAANWPVVNSKKGEDLDSFLTRVKEGPHQLNLGLEQHEKLFENWRKFISEEKTIDEDAIGMAQDLAASGKLGYDDVSQTDLPKASGRAIKDAFRKNADHQWLATLNTVHWGYDAHALADVIDKSKDELSATMSLPGAPFVRARPHPVGILIKGRITLAANDQDRLYSGGYFDYMGSDDEKEATKQQHRARSSGVNKLPQISKDFSRYGMLKRGNPYMEQMAIDAIPYVLDQQTWDWDPDDPDSSGINEALVDNWRPLGLVARPSDIVRAVKSMAHDPSIAIGETKNLFALAEKHGLPILDLEQNVLWDPNK